MGWRPSVPFVENSIVIFQELRFLGILKRL